MINNVVLVGRITKDVEVRKTQTGLSVASFTLAVNRRKISGRDNEADFINCIVWRSGADFVGKYCGKGSLIGIEGRIQTRNYDGSDGRRVYITEVVCDSVQSLEYKKNNTNENQVDLSESGFGYSDENKYNSNLDLSADDLPF